MPPGRDDGLDAALEQVSDALELRMLGPLEAWRGERRLVLGGQRQRSVLACLVLDPGRDVSTDRIIDAVWGDQPPPGVATTLQTYVFHLREALEPNRLRGAPASVVVTVPGGYRLSTDEAAVDAARFEELVRTGRETLAEDPRKAAQLLSNALALWRGDVLADLPELNGVSSATTSRLTELRVSATEAWVKAELALGHHEAVLSALDDLVERHPLREHLASLQMLALYRAGRQSDALEAYRRLRRTLREELGIQPSAEVETMQQRVLRQDPSLLVTPPPLVASAKAGADAEPDSAAPADPPSPAIGDRGPAGEPRRRAVAAIAAVVLVAGLALAGVVIFLHRGDVTPLPGNSVGPVDALGLRGDAVPLDSAPSALLSAGGAVWAALENSNSVVKIDPSSRKVIETVRQVGASPQALATSGDDLWVAAFDEGVLTRINIPTGAVVQKIPVGIEPAAVAAAPDGVWVANSGDNTVQRVDPSTDKADPAIDVGSGPDALALDGTTLWVANGRGGTISQIDTRTGKRAASDIPVNAGPAALAVTPTDVWVANEFDQSVSRVPRSSLRVKRIDVADGPSSLVVHDGQVWVANRYGASVSRIDIDTNVVSEDSLGSAPVAITDVDGELWAAAGAYANGEHRGGTLVWTGFGYDIDSLDPASGTVPMYVNLWRVAYDGLVTQRLTAGRRSLSVVADLATLVPDPADGGRTYVFSIRSDIRYSTGTLVRPSDFIRGLKRVLRPDTGGAESFEDIVGAASCMGTDPLGCNLSGVEADDVTGRLTIRLNEPDPEFVDKLTNLVYPRPPGYAAETRAGAPLPSTGPYQIANVDHGSVTLIRNPYFHQWSAAAQPEGYPDVIVYHPFVDQQAGLADVLNGRAQGAYVDGVLPTAVASHPDKIRTLPYDELQVQYIFPNTTIAPFNDERVRQALSYALDRRRVAEIMTAKPACQLVPPSFPGFQPYCPQQSGPASGAYQGPDLVKARELVDESGTKGTPVTVQYRPDYVEGIARYTASVLTELGYRAVVRAVPDDVGDRSDPYFESVQLVVPFGWLADYPSPGTFYDYVTSCRKKSFIRSCSKDVDATAAQARALARTDPRGALQAWAKVDQMLIDTAAIIPTDAQIGTVVVSPEVGNVLLRPINGPILSQMWVR